MRVLQNSITHHNISTFNYYGIQTSKKSRNQFAAPAG